MEKKSKLPWIIIILIAIIILGYLFLVVSGISGQVVEAIEKIWGKS